MQPFTFKLSGVVTAIESAMLMAAIMMAATGVIVEATIVVTPHMTRRFEQPGNPPPLVSDPSLDSSIPRSKPQLVGHRYHNPGSGDYDHEPPDHQSAVITSDMARSYRTFDAPKARGRPGG